MNEVIISKEEAENYIKSCRYGLTNVDSIEDSFYEDIIIITDDDIEKLRNGAILKHSDGDFDHFLVYRNRKMENK